MIKEMIAQPISGRTFKNEMTHHLYLFDEEGERPKRKSKIPMVHVSKNTLSCYFFDYLTEHHVPTYFIEKHSEDAMRVKPYKELPFELCFRNRALSTFASQYGLNDSQELETPLIDYFFTSEKDSHKLINESYLPAFGIVEPEELKLIIKQASKVNAILKSFFNRRGLILNELRLRFVRSKSSILLGFEFTPDTMNVSEKEPNKKARFNWETEHPMAFYERVIGF